VFDAGTHAGLVAVLPALELVDLLALAYALVVKSFAFGPLVLIRSFWLA
jgi:hypothetical protein